VEDKIREINDELEDEMVAAPTPPQIFPVSPQIFPLHTGKICERRKDLVRSGHLPSEEGRCPAQPFGFSV